MLFDAVYTTYIWNDAFNNTITKNEREIEKEGSETKMQSMISRKSRQIRITRSYYIINITAR